MCTPLYRIDKFEKYFSNIDLEAADPDKANKAINSYMFLKDMAKRVETEESREFYGGRVGVHEAIHAIVDKQLKNIKIGRNMHEMFATNIPKGTKDDMKYDDEHEYKWLGVAGANTFAINGLNTAQYFYQLVQEDNMIEQAKKAGALSSDYMLYKDMDVKIAKTSDGAIVPFAQIHEQEISATDYLSIKAPANDEIRRSMAARGMPGHLPN